MDDGPVVEAPLSAGPPPLFDVTSFSKWVTDVFTEEHDDEVLDKLAAMDASDDMAKMRLLLNEEATARRTRLTGDPILKSYQTPEEGAGSRDVMIICFAGENDHLVRQKKTLPATRWTATRHWWRASFARPRAGHPRPLSPPSANYRDFWQHLPPASIPSDCTLPLRHAPCASPRLLAVRRVELPAQPTTLVLDSVVEGASAMARCVSTRLPCHCGCYGCYGCCGCCGCCSAIAAAALPSRA